MLAGVAGVFDVQYTPQMKYWEIIADNLSKAGWTGGCVATVDARGRTIFVADAHRSDRKQFVVRADELLTAFLELENALGSDFDERFDKCRITFI